MDGRSPEFYELAHVHPGAELSVFGRLMIINPLLPPPSSEYFLLLFRLLSDKEKYRISSSPNTIIAIDLISIQGLQSNWSRPSSAEVISFPGHLCFSKFAFQKKGGIIWIDFFPGCFDKYEKIQVYGGDWHPPPHSLQRVTSTGSSMLYFLSQSTRIPSTSASSYS